MSDLSGPTARDNGVDTPVDQASAKGAAVGTLLEERDEERRKAVERRKEEAREKSDPRENVDAFVEQAQRQREEWVEALRSFAGTTPTPSEVQDSLGKLTAELQGMASALSEASYFLPGYDQRSIASSHREMHQHLEEIRTQLLPKKKFSFGSGRVARKKGAIAGEAAAAKQTAAPVSPSNAPPPPPEVVAGRGLQDVEGQTLVLYEDQLGGMDFTLVNLKACKVYLLGRMSALRCHKLQDCEVYSGPVSGSSFLDSISRCTLHLASHQVRIHSTTETDLYLRVRSNPIIEHSSGLRVAPYAFANWKDCSALLSAAGLSADSVDVDGKWMKVDDFGWLRAVQSPNWCILPEGDRKFVDGFAIDL